MNTFDKKLDKAACYTRMYYKDDRELEPPTINYSLAGVTVITFSNIRVIL